MVRFYNHTIFIITDNLLAPAGYANSTSKDFLKLIAIVIWTIRKSTMCQKQIQ